MTRNNITEEWVNDPNTKKEELKDALRERELPVRGNKPVLQRRFIAYLREEEKLAQADDPTDEMGETAQADAPATDEPTDDSGDLPDDIVSARDVLMEFRGLILDQATPDQIMNLERLSAKLASGDESAIRESQRVVADIANALSPSGDLVTCSELTRLMSPLEGLVSTVDAYRDRLAPNGNTAPPPVQPAHPPMVNMEEDDAVDSERKRDEDNAVAAAQKAVFLATRKALRYLELKRRTAVRFPETKEPPYALGHPKDTNILATARMLCEIGDKLRLALVPLTSFEAVHFDRKATLRRETQKSYQILNTLTYHTRFILGELVEEFGGDKAKELKTEVVGMKLWEIHDKLSELLEFIPQPPPAQADEEPAPKAPAADQTPSTDEDRAESSGTTQGFTSADMEEVNALRERVSQQQAADRTPSTDEDREVSSGTTKPFAFVRKEEDGPKPFVYMPGARDSAPADPTPSLEEEPQDETIDVDAQAATTSASDLEADKKTPAAPQRSQEEIAAERFEKILEANMTQLSSLDNKVETLQGVANNLIRVTSDLDERTANLEKWAEKLEDHGRTTLSKAVQTAEELQQLIREHSLRTEGGDDERQSS